MIWLAWRQFRVQALSVAGGLLVFVGALALTWTRVTTLAEETGFTGCRDDVACRDAADRFLRAIGHESAGALYLAGLVLLLVLPALLGIFWGAPLVARELESGTYRMVFSQTVSRRRWLLVKLAVGGIAAALSVGLVSLVLTRWAAPIDAAGSSRVEPITFLARGIVPVASAVLAFAVGVAVGLVLRRTLTAMAVTLLLVVAVQVVATPVMLRLLAQPITTVTPLRADTPMVLIVNTGTVHLDAGNDRISGAWMIEESVVTQAGKAFTGPVDATKCNISVKGELPEQCRDWLVAQNLGHQLTYVPGTRFWPLQWRVFGVLSALTVALVLFSGGYLGGTPWSPFRRGSSAAPATRSARRP
ncbi:ABC transporter permease subunit [Actinoplanes sp. CA-015351]|uniref:ABC transporter permease subunit n=1 Tax=Actinoplanes sp. CA-015351 TaxID=3239897 RepID=UPI003D9919FB